MTITFAYAIHLNFPAISPIHMPSNSLRKIKKKTNLDKYTQIWKLFLLRNITGGNEKVELVTSMLIYLFNCSCCLFLISSCNIIFLRNHSNIESGLFVLAKRNSPPWALGAKNGRYSVGSSHGKISWSEGGESAYVWLANSSTTRGDWDIVE